MYPQTEVWANPTSGTCVHRKLILVPTRTLELASLSAQHSAAALLLPRAPDDSSVLPTCTLHCNPHTFSALHLIILLYIHLMRNQTYFVDLCDRYDGSNTLFAYINGCESVGVAKELKEDQILRCMHKISHLPSLRENKAPQPLGPSHRHSTVAKLLAGSTSLYKTTHWSLVI